MYERLSTGLGSAREILTALKAVEPNTIDMLDLGILHLGRIHVDTLTDIYVSPMSFR